MTDDNPTIVEAIPMPTVGRWIPAIGPETLDFLSTVVPEGSRDSMRDAAASIIAKSVPPTGEAGRETGLVVGYVQSGKTMSIETVATLARDNAFQIVIVVVGISISLLKQSTGRLHRDLRLDDPDRPRRWIPFQNPSADDPTVQALRDVLDDWRDPGTPHDFKKTILITVLKHHKRLQDLTDLIRALKLVGVPVLIIDDEADQASLNNEVAQRQESTTYRRFMELRQALPTHTYLQYTATPQAPLLVSIIDSLSPNFVQVLEPGDAYVGGQEFFGGDLTLVCVIPPEDVPTNAFPLVEPPESLLDALRIFMVGVAAGIKQGVNIGNRSMLVHPSHRTAQHQEYYDWVRDIVEEWKRIFALQESEPDKQELIEDFRITYNDLAQTVGDTLPAFDELMKYFLVAFRNTRVLEVNTREGQKTPTVDWRSAYGWILVAGQAVDRGFTVEGLTVTYMPRGIGMGNADTVQQRARFFGYKRPYLGYCRVYLEQGTLQAYQAYVEHEGDIRTQLMEFQESGQPLDNWKRVFILNTDLRPCRNHVLEFDYIHGLFSNSWANPHVVLPSEDIAQANRKTVTEFVQGLTFTESDGHPDRTAFQRHHVCRDILLRTAMEQLLVSMRITGATDSQRNIGLLLQLTKALEANPNEVCTIYKMSPTTGRSRGINESGEITYLFQGQAPVQPVERRGEIYPGDQAIHDDDNVTIQIHELELTSKNSTQVVAKDIPVLAVWVPERLGRAWVVQDPQ